MDQYDDIGEEEVEPGEGQRGGIKEDRDGGTQES